MVIIVVSGGITNATHKLTLDRQAVGSSSLVPLATSGPNATLTCSISTEGGTSIALPSAENVTADTAIVCTWLHTVTAAEVTTGYLPSFSVIARRFTRESNTPVKLADAAAPVVGLNASPRLTLEKVYTGSPYIEIGATAARAHFPWWQALS